MKKQYSFGEYLNHIAQAKAEAVDYAKVVASTEVDQATQALIESAYNAGARDSVSLIKLHGGFKFNY